MSTKKDFIIPVLVLSLICFFVSGALAVVNTYTLPKIEKDAAARAKLEMEKIMPQANDFIELKDIPNLPRTISGIFNAKNKAGDTLGYLFMISVPGYGGNINLICGVGNDGIIIRTQVLSHTETKGMTDPVFADPSHPAGAYQSQYIGKDKNLENIIAVTGATVSSTAYKNGIRDALLAFKILKQEALP